MVDITRINAEPDVIESVAWNAIPKTILGEYYPLKRIADWNGAPRYQAPLCPHAFRGTAYNCDGYLSCGEIQRQQHRHCLCKVAIANGDGRNPFGFKCPLGICNPPEGGE